jgi:hypothetical protein
MIDVYGEDIVAALILFGGYTVFGRDVANI